jgi:cytochrome b561
MKLLCWLCIALAVFSVALGVFMACTEGYSIRLLSLAMCTGAFVLNAFTFRSLCRQRRF